VTRWKTHVVIKTSSQRKIKCCSRRRKGVKAKQPKTQETHGKMHPKGDAFPIFSEGRGGGEGTEPGPDKENHLSQKKNREERDYNSWEGPQVPPEGKKGKQA